MKTDIITVKEQMIPEVIIYNKMFDEPYFFFRLLFSSNIGFLRLSVYVQYILRVFHHVQINVP